MGQKVNPHGLRVGVIKDWDSKWYADKNNFADCLIEDQKVREFIKKKLYTAGIAKILIERKGDSEIKVIILTGRPGMVIGKAGDGIEKLKADLVNLTKKSVVIDIKEIRRTELDAQLSAESIAQALENRVSFRRAMKQAMGRTMKANAKGIKVLVSGRLGGAEMARSEKYSEGNVPLHTLRANIEYGFAEADTTYGKLGVKVWINHGEILDKDLKGPTLEEERKDRNGKRDGDRNKRKGGDNRKPRRDGDRNKRDDAPKAPKANNPRGKVAKKVAPAVETAQVEEVVEANVSEASVEE